MSEVMGSRSAQSARNAIRANGLRLVAIAVALCLTCSCIIPVGAIRSVVMSGTTMAGSRLLRSTVDNPIAPAKRPPADGNRIALGTEAPKFELSDALGEIFRSEDFRKAPALVVTFTSRSCLLDQSQRASLVTFAQDFQKRGVVLVVVNSQNPARSPEDGTDEIAAEVVAAGYPFFYLVDYKQEIARAFLAQRTSEFYVFDRSRRLAYLGPFDDGLPEGTVEPTGRFLRAAVERSLAGRSADSAEPSAVGCPILWKTEGGPVGRASRSSRLESPSVASTHPAVACGVPRRRSPG